MTVVFGVATIIALVAAVSILTIGSYSCIKPMADELFKSKEELIRTDIDGDEIMVWVPVHVGDGYQKARDTIRNLPATLRLILCIVSVGPAALIAALFNIEFDIGRKFFTLRTGIPFETAIMIGNYMYQGFLLVIGVYLVYIVFVILYVSRIAVPFFHTFNETGKNN